MMIYNEESTIWAKGHHIAEAAEFAKLDTEQYVIYLRATHKPIRFIPHSRHVAENWIQSESTRISLLWKIHRDRIYSEDCEHYVDVRDEPDPMVEDQDEDDVEIDPDFPDTAEVYQMMDD
eukprot:2911605-Amphidinium_carterae.1